MDYVRSYKDAWLQLLLYNTKLLLVLSSFRLNLNQNQNKRPTTLKSVELARDYQNKQALGVQTVFSQRQSVPLLEWQSISTKAKVVWTVVEANAQQTYMLTEYEIVGDNNQDASLRFSML
jgi:hypothetical protein